MKHQKTSVESIFAAVALVKEYPESFDEMTKPEISNKLSDAVGAYVAATQVDRIFDLAGVQRKLKRNGGQEKIALSEMELRYIVKTLSSLSPNPVPPSLLDKAGIEEDQLV